MRSGGTTISSAKTAEPIEMSFGVLTWVGPSCYALGGSLDCHRGRGILRGHLPAHCEVWGISGVSQSYLIDGSTDVTFHCQYCSNLFLHCACVGGLTAFDSVDKLQVFNVNTEA